MRRAAFLDRDGVLNVDTGYVHRAEDWQWQEGAIEAVRLLNEAAIVVVVITNQSGIGRGYYSEADLQALHEHIQSELKSHGARIDAFYHCPHRPEDECECRKPKPGMILQAIRDFNLDASRSFLIGDRESDIEAARAAGVRGYLFAGGSLDQLVRELIS